MTAPLPPRAPLMPLDEARRAVLEGLLPLAATETVATVNAKGRFLAQDLVSPLQVPPQDNSSMDGYALCAADVREARMVLRVSQRVPAGTAPHVLEPGTAARIFTGAPIPPGADTVVMQEDTEPVGGDVHGVRLLSVPQAGQWIRRAGEDVTRGAVVLRRGQRIGPAEAGLAASLGRADLPVVARPRVALFSTGDELVMPGEQAPEQMPAGAIYNSNRFMLRALLEQLGCAVSDLGIVPDRREATVDALRQAAQGHDLIVTSGGVSVGEEDHIKPAVLQLGRLNLWQIAMKPGKPLAFGAVRRSDAADDSCHFMGLPGNPVSSFVTFLLLVRPFLLRLSGVADPLALDAARALHLRADFDLPRPDRRREFLRVRRNTSGGLDLFPNQSSGVLTSAVWGDGLVDNPAGTAIQRGDLVSYFSFSDLLA